MANPPRTAPGASAFTMEYDAEGFPLCRRCKTSIRTGKRPKARTFCSAECVHEWKLRTSPSYQAAHVLERDHGVCAACGLDCVTLLKDLEHEATAEATRLFGDVARWQVWRLVDRLPDFEARCVALGLPPHLRRLSRRLWEMDHTVPVVEGGGSCGLENLRTLCWSCHRVATARLAARRAEARRAG